MQTWIYARAMQVTLGRQDLLRQQFLGKMGPKHVLSQ